MKRVVVLPDMHVPYHDKKALSLVLDVCKGIKATHLVCLGDFVDFYSVSSFPKDPMKIEFLKDEVEEANKVLDQIDQTLKGLDIDKTMIEGNHEFRLTRWINNTARAMYGMVSTEGLMNFSQRGWKFVPYGDHCRIGKLLFTHEGVKSGKYFCGAAIDRYHASVCVGHHHKIQHIEKVTPSGRHVSFCPGTLADIDAISEYITGPVNWHLGFATVLIKDNGMFFSQIHPIIKNECFVWGRMYK